MNGSSTEKELALKKGIFKAVKQEQMTFGGAAWTGLLPHTEVIDQIESIDIGLHFLEDTFTEKDFGKNTHPDTLFSQDPYSAAILFEQYGLDVFTPSYKTKKGLANCEKVVTDACITRF